MNKKRSNTLLPLVQLLPAVAAAAAVLFALPRTVPVLAAVPERLTAVVEQPMEAAFSEAEEEALPKLPYADGVYVGSSRGYGGTVRVQVTMENGSITEVEILDASHETKQFLRRAKRLLTTVVEAQSWEVDAVSGAPLTAEGQISAGGIGHCARACGCRYWQRRCSSSCWAAGWVSAGLSELKMEAAARYLCSSLLLAGMICHFYRECFCSNRSVMLCRLMPRVERLCSMALVAGGRTPSAPRRMSAELKLSTKR